MWTVFVHTLYDSFHRRMSLILIVVCFLVAGVYLSIVRIERQPDGTQMVHIVRTPPRTVETFMKDLLRSQLQITSELWLFLGLFSAAQLLATFQEKGWVDLQLSKGIARWKVLGGRVAGAIGVFLWTTLLMNGVLVGYFAWRLGYTELRSFWAGLLLLTLSFVGAVAFLTLVAVSQRDTSILIVAVGIEFGLTEMLASREQTIYKLFSARWVHWSLDWMYRIMPKHSELYEAAMLYLKNQTWREWWPVWSTALFIVAALALAIAQFQRKAF
jgi:ABC-type transport system involved in multi-copper enzyme maturation permease subunit